MSPDMTPRNEHPRPDFHRGLTEGQDWLNLNGHWDFEFDPEDKGEAEGWQDGSGTLARRILVPFGWESHLAWGTENQASNTNWYSPEGFLDPQAAAINPEAILEKGEMDWYRHNLTHAERQTIGWYRRSFNVPESWDGRRIILHIGAVDYEYNIWVNGSLAAEGESGYTPVDVDITDLLQEGENTLVVRAHDPQDHQYQPVGKQWEWYARTAGIWQTVWLEPRPEAHIAGLQVYTEAKLGRVTVKCNVAGSEEGLRVRARISGGEAGGTAKVEAGVGIVTLQIEDAKLWSPESPALYDLEVDLYDADDNFIDTVFSYFGIREVTIQPLRVEGPKYIHLNGQPVYLRGALDQSFTPDGVYTFASDDDIRRDIQLAKESGFNFLRIHIKLEDPRLLYWADRLGVLLMCDMPNYGYDSFSELSNARWERTFRAAVDRDFNHPSIFSWCLFNETWGFGFEKLKTAPDMQEWIWDMWALAKRLDPTRVIEDDSACNYDHVVTDLNSWHFYINDYEQAKEHVAHVVKETYPGSHFNYCPAFRQHDEPLMNSEYGGIGAGSGDKDVSWCFRFLTNELRKYREICGYVYTELQDIEWEHNGFFDYDRSPKEFGYDPTLLQGEVFVGFDAPPGIVVKPGEAVSLPAFLSNFGDPQPLAFYTSVQFTDALGGEQLICQAYSEWSRGEERGEVIPLPPLGFNAPDQAGLCKVTTSVLNAANQEIASNFAVVEVRPGPLPEVEQCDDGRLVLRKLAGDLEDASTWHEAEIERGRIPEVPWAEEGASHADGGSASAGVASGDVHYVSGVGDGSFSYRFEIPADVDLAAATSIALLFEASSRIDGAPQTSVYKSPTDITVAINNVTVHEQTLADQPADARGALSHMHGLHGRYGELVNVELSGEKLSQVLESFTGGLTVTISVPAGAEHVSGLGIYSSRAGRYPIDMTLIIATGCPSQENA